MLNKKRVKLNAILIVAIILVSICIFAALRSVDKSSVGSEIHIYNINISEDNQRNIWKYSEKNKLSYELVLAIYQTGIENDSLSNNISKEIEELAYYRDYWTELGFPDEIVYSLILISKERGIKGCSDFIENNDVYDQNNYVQKVTEYKFFLEQISYADSTL